jgi:hypothetical protein
MTILVYILIICILGRPHLLEGHHAPRANTFGPRHPRGGGPRLSTDHSVAASAVARLRADIPADTPIRAVGRK